MDRCFLKEWKSSNSVTFTILIQPNMLLSCRDSLFAIWSGWMYCSNDLIRYYLKILATVHHAPYTELITYCRTNRFQTICFALTCVFTTLLSVYLFGLLDYTNVDRFSTIFLRALFSFFQYSLLFVWFFWLSHMCAWFSIIANKYYLFMYTGPNQHILIHSVVNLAWIVRENELLEKNVLRLFTTQLNNLINSSENHINFLKTF